MKKDHRKENEFEEDLYSDSKDIGDEYLSDEEVDILRQSIHGQKVDRSKLPPHDNSDRAKALRYAKKNVPFLATVAICVICIITIIALAVVFAIRNAKSATNTDDFVISVGEETYIMEYSYAMRENKLYIDMRKVASEGGLIVSGTKKTASFSTLKGQYVSFEDKSETAMINGNKVELGGVAEVTSEVCMVPFEFINTVLDIDGNGIRISYNSVDNTIEIKRRFAKTDDGLVPLDILFTTESFEIITAPIDPDTLYQYNIDISPYLDSIKTEYLLLVNKDKENYLGSDYVPENLVKLTCNTRDPLRNWEFQLCEDAANALYAMMLEMEQAGLDDVKITSAYRPYSYQVTLFEKYVADNKRLHGMSQEEAEKEAEKTSARPGSSEHQSGLCVDFVTDDYPSLTEEFERSEAFEWLSVNAYKFGFILRYPKTKEDLTGYSYEPWHYRFVGREAATQIYESGLSLEEYLQ